MLNEIDKTGCRMWKTRYSNYLSLFSDCLEKNNLDMSRPSLSKVCKHWINCSLHELSILFLQFPIVEITFTQIMLKFMFNSFIITTTTTTAITIITTTGPTVNTLEYSLD